MRLLIIEDETKLATALKRALELNTYAVDLTTNGIDGYDLAETGDYDLILLDVMLPGMTGIDICTQLRTNQIHTPILMLTAKGQLQDKLTGLDSGADDYLIKPFAMEELFSRIRALLRRSSNSTQPILTAGPLSLNPQTFTVHRDKSPITLSTKEFALLEYLMRHPNQTLTKQQLVDHVWDYDSDILPNTVEVHIKNLRDKIDKPFNHPLIKTIRGFGYQINTD